MKWLAYVPCKRPVPLFLQNAVNHNVILKCVIFGMRTISFLNSARHISPLFESRFTDLLQFHFHKTNGVSASCASSAWFSIFVYLFIVYLYLSACSICMRFFVLFKYFFIVFMHFFVLFINVFLPCIYVTFCACSPHSGRLRLLFLHESMLLLLLLLHRHDRRNICPLHLPRVDGRQEGPVSHLWWAPLWNFDEQPFEISIKNPLKCRWNPFEISMKPLWNFDRKPHCGFLPPFNAHLLLHSVDYAWIWCISLRSSAVIHMHVICIYYIYSFGLQARSRGRSCLLSFGFFCVAELMCTSGNCWKSWWWWWWWWWWCWSSIITTTPSILLRV